jgi:hypothetical protein
MIVDAGEYIGKPSLRIDVVELCRRDQRSYDSSTIGAAFRRDLIMPGVWGKKLRLHIHSTRCFNGLRS